MIKAWSSAATLQLLANQKTTFSVATHEVRFKKNGGYWDKLANYFA